MPAYNFNFEASIFERDGGLRYRMERVLGCEKKLRNTHRHAMEAINRAERAMDDFMEALVKLEAEMPLAQKRDQKRVQVYTNKLEWEIKQLQKQVNSNQNDTLVPTVHPSDLQRAKTIAIFDAILFAMENWSTDGQVASDFSLICQSLLFPIVYEEVMSGNEDYYIEQVPSVSLEVVRRGREFVKYLRNEFTQALTEEDVWPKACALVHEWCINDMLPLLYGARDDDWKASTAYSLAQMLQWRDMPQSRLLNFPKIQDAMDLVKEHGDIIRESTKLPDFTKQTLTTRIEP